jgi:hypothetical protein
VAGSQVEHDIRQIGDCAYRKSHSAVFTNVTLLHCAQNLPQYPSECLAASFAGGEVSLANKRTMVRIYNKTVVRWQQLCY